MYRTVGSAAQAVSAGPRQIADDSGPGQQDHRKHEESAAPRVAIPES